MMHGRATGADQVATLKNALKALQPFFDLRDTMPLQYVRAFMLVATDPGHNVTWYANKAGISPSLMARHLEDIGEVDRYRKPGFWAGRAIRQPKGQARASDTPDR
jgi:hypothetical protein